MALTSCQQALPMTRFLNYSSVAHRAMIWDKRQISAVSGVLSGKIRGLNAISNIRSD
jgi:hypothetical protein